MNTTAVAKGAATTATASLKDRAEHAAHDLVVQAQDASKQAQAVSRKAQKTVPAALESHLDLARDRALEAVGRTSRRQQRRRRRLVTVGLVVLGAGVAWLALNRAQDTDTVQQARSEFEDKAAEAKRRAESKAEEVADKAQDAASTAADKAKHLADEAETKAHEGAEDLRPRD